MGVRRAGGGQRGLAGWWVGGSPRQAAALANIAQASGVLMVNFVCYLGRKATNVGRWHGAARRGPGRRAAPCTTHLGTIHDKTEVASLTSLRLKVTVVVGRAG